MVVPTNLISLKHIFLASSLPDKHNRTKQNKRVSCMGEEAELKKISDGSLNGFSQLSSAPLFWKSRKRSSATANTTVVSAKDTNESMDDPVAEMEKQQEASSSPEDHKKQNQELTNSFPVMSQKRKALFEPLEPVNNPNGKRPLADSSLPPPDFESASYPKGWLIGKKRKLVNVDVVESMRRIAVQEMNRKDREIDGLNNQLEDDARCLEHLQLKLLDERSKRADVERHNMMLQDQITMLMDMLQENEGVDGN